MSTTSDMAPNRRKPTTTGSASDATVDKTREDELEAQVAQLRSDLQAIGETLKKLTAEKADEAKGELRHLQRKGQDMVADAQNQAEEYEQQLKDTIREKPLTAVATALGIGFVLALVTRH